MKKFLPVLVVVLILSLSQIFMFVSVQGLEDSAGVKVGDWAKYSVTATWQSNMPGNPEPLYYQDLRDIDWIRVEIEAMAAADVTAMFMTHFKNGTETTQTLMGNFETGMGNLTTSFPLPFAPLVTKKDLEIGDEIPGLLIQNVTEIESKVVASYHRDTVYSEQNISSSGMSMIEEYRFDKATGILCEAVSSTSISFLSYSTSSSTRIQMAETNMFMDQIHDLAVKLVELPYATTPINPGSQVNVTISIKNEGTETETFNVTAYCNTTQIWQQQMVNLTGGQTKHVSFMWNTTSLAEGTYSIKATVNLPRDANTTDNNYTLQSVTIKKPATPTQPLPLDIIAYAVVAVTAVLVITVVVYRRRGRKTKPKS